MELITAILSFLKVFSFREIISFLVIFLSLFLIGKNIDISSILLFFKSA